VRASAGAAEIHDLTNGEYWFADGGPGELTVAWLGSVTDGGGGVPSFTTASFTNAEVNGDYHSAPV